MVPKLDQRRGYASKRRIPFCCSVATKQGKKPAAGQVMGQEEDENWILRKFADSGKKHFRWKRADVPRKPNNFFDLL